MAELAGSADMRVEFNGVDITPYVSAISPATGRPPRQTAHHLKEALGDFAINLSAGWNDHTAELRKQMQQAIREQERKQRAEQRRQQHELYIRRKFEWLVDRAIVRYREKGAQC